MGVRTLVAVLFIVFCFGILTMQLWKLQVQRYQGFSERADKNRLAWIPIEPRRGDIFDRNGVVLARNNRDYTIEILPSQAKNVKKLVDEIATIISISPAERRRFQRNLANAGRFDAVILKSGLSDDEAAMFSVHAYQFQGAALRARWVREYPEGDVAGHIVGYVGRISANDQARIEEQGQEGNYRGTHVIGKRGIEASYERFLHGKTGWEEVEVSASGRPVRTISHIDPTPGDDVYLSIDIGLQKLVEGLYRDPKQPRRGALVALDIKTGEVLAYVSEPSYNPNWFIDGISEENWSKLSDNPAHPLINRPIASAYPIGSTYKPFVALAMLYYKVRDPDTLVPDPGYFEFNGKRFRNAGGAVYGPTNLRKALSISSDTYFFSLGPLIDVDRLKEFMPQFGFGVKTGVDLDGEKTGVLPSKDWKAQLFRKSKDPSDRKWHIGESISLTVGQGYNAFTMMQLAQATATLARKGDYIAPHLVSLLANTKTQKAQRLISRLTHKVHLPAAQWEAVHQALQEVTTTGTASATFEGAHYVSAGKTGTAQVFSLRGSKYDAKSLPEHLRDHALYMGYAPVNDPKIAVALIVENGGWGASLAAPIARQVFDYWLSPERQKHISSRPVIVPKPLTPLVEKVLPSDDVDNHLLPITQQEDAQDMGVPIEDESAWLHRVLQDRFELQAFPYDHLPRLQEQP